MGIHFVIGPPCAGKSHFIAENFGEATVIDLLNFQDRYKALTEETVAMSYKDAEEALIKAIEDNKPEIILEHTLLKAIRRAIYIEAVRKVTDRAITCHVILPDREEYARRCKERGENPIIMSGGYELFEMPDESEGFESVHIIR